MSDTSQLLALETATSSCSVALRAGGKIIQRQEEGSNIHSKLLLQMVSDVLAEAEIELDQVTGIAVGQGPGSFTGLRIGVGVAQGLAYGIDCPMYGVSSLTALAHQVTEQEIDWVLAGIDARMEEIYWAVFHRQDKRWLLQGQIQVSSPQELCAQVGENNELGEGGLVGNAWSVYGEQLSKVFLDRYIHNPQIRFPSASAVLEIAEQSGAPVSPIDFAPHYVRNNVAKKSEKKTF